MKKKVREVAPAPVGEAGESSPAVVEETTTVAPEPVVVPNEKATTTPGE